MAARAALNPAETAHAYPFPLVPEPDTLSMFRFDRSQIQIRAKYYYWICSFANVDFDSNTLSTFLINGS